MQEDTSEVSQEDCEECVEALFRLAKEGRQASLPDLMSQPDLSDRPVADIVLELALNGHVDLAGEGLALTAKGREIGQRIYARHELAEKLLRSLGLRESSAHEEACRVEHLLDDSALAAATRRLGRFEVMLDSGVSRLCDVSVGEYEIVLLSMGRSQRRRLQDMGLGQGARVHVQRRRPRGPVEVEAHGARLALGHGVAAKVLVTPIVECAPAVEPAT
jgi:DtxR family transcriptional regulator, Mn-dependent transcriptional regulator